MSEEIKITHSELSDHTKGKLTAEEQINFLQMKLEQAELRATEKGIALIEMTASRNALYQSLQDAQMRLAETLGQRENDIEAYQKELDARLQEKRQLQEQCDALAIKAKRYDELQESVVKIKMNAERRAHSVIDEAQEKAMDTVMLIDEIEKEIRLFSEDVTFLRRDIRIGTITLDDRLDNVYRRLCQSLDKLLAIREDFYIRNSLPLDSIMDAVPKGDVPILHYPVLLNPPTPPSSPEDNAADEFASDDMADDDISDGKTEAAAPDNTADGTSPDHTAGSDTAETPASCPTEN